MSNLTLLPNIGKELCQKLKEVDINTSEELERVGTEQAFLRLRAIDQDACLSKLCAIEGAIQRIRWHHISPDRKLELKQFFHLINKSIKQ